MNKIIKILTIGILCISLTACSLPFLGSSNTSKAVIIAGGNTSERQILAEIQKQMINHYLPKLDVQIINNLGSTTLIVQTFIKKISNMSAIMYTGTSLTGELGLEANTNPKEAFDAVVKGYKEKFDMKWYPSYGFENTYAFMVRKDFAKKHNIQKISDLKKISNTLRAGVDTSWLKREGDGYEAFKEIYGFDFKKAYPMEIGLVYDAVKNNKMDIVLGYSTDGRINSYDLISLEDDKRLFPPYDACPVVSYDLIKKYPEVDKVITKLIGKIDSKKMQELNKYSDEDKIEPNTIAKKFLQENNYFE